MAWNIEGTYFETCSCELMCPCNLSFDHGATYDYCRATLVFNIKQGEIEGTDVGGLSVCAIIDTPKVMTEGNWRIGVFVDDKASDEQMEKLLAVFTGRRAGRWKRSGRWSARCSASSARRSTSSRTGSVHSVKIGDAIDFEVKDIVPFGVENGQPVAARRALPSGRVGAHRRGGDPLEDQRLRDRVRGQDRALQLQLRLGGLSRLKTKTPPPQKGRLRCYRPRGRRGSGFAWSR